MELMNLLTFSFKEIGYNHPDLTRLMDRVLETLAGIAHDAESIQSTQFGRPSPFSSAVLESTEWFTATRIREAEPQEQALFLPAAPSSSSSAPALSGIVKRATATSDGELDARKKNRRTWTAVKRMPPERRQRFEQASPLKKAVVAHPASRSSADTTKIADDAERCLRAAQKLLQVYVMPRAKDHVDSLLARFEAVTDSISEREEALRNSTSTKNKASTKATSTSKEVQMEELELLALRDLAETLKQKNKSLDAKLKKRKKPKNEPNAERVPSKREKPQTPTSPQTRKSQTPLKSKDTSEAGSSSIPAPINPPIETSDESAPSNPVHTATEPMPDIQPSSISMETNVVFANATTQNTTIANEDIPPATTEMEAESLAQQDLENAEELSKRKKLAEELAAGLWGKIGHILSTFSNEPPTEDSKPSLSDTLHALINICESNLDNSSTGSISSTGVNTDTLSPGAILEAFLLVQFFNSLLDDTPSIPSSYIVIRPSHMNPSQKLPFFRFAEMKTILGEESKRRGWGEELSTKAIYGLVGKRCLRIDRRGHEPLLAWDIEVEGSL